jgi:sugar phosphate isomerase/epimerase
MKGGRKVPRLTQVGGKLHSRVSINTLSSFNWPLAQDLALVAELGVRHFGFPMLKIDEDVPGGVAAIQASGLDVACVAASASNSSLLDPDAAFAVLKPAIDTATTLGSPLCYFTSGKSLPGGTTDAACEALVAALQPARAYAAQRGVRLGIENNSTTTRHLGFVHTLRDAIQLAEEADIQICLELQNCWVERGLAGLFRAHAGRFGVVQVSDYRVGEDVRLNRRVPGDGSIPLVWLIEQLLEAGYTGLFEIEVLGPHIEAEGYAPAIRRSADWLSGVLERCGA